MWAATYDTPDLVAEYGMTYDSSLMNRDTPFRRHAQIVWPALLMFFLQAVQIDIEKWRHVYMMLGMIWGLEAARLRWLAGRA